MPNPFDDQILLANEAYHNGDLRRAEALCRAGIESTPDQWPAKLLLGVITARTGRSEESVALLRQVLAAEPNHYEALNWLAGQLRKTGKIGEAIDLALRATEIQSESVDAYITLGISYLAAGEPLDAVPPLRRAIGLQPNLAVAHHNLATALERAGDTDAAIGEYRRAIELAPKVANAYVSLGQLLLYRGDRIEADRCFEGAFQTVSHAPRGLVELAKALMEESLLAQAERCLRRAVELEPAALAPQELLGAVLQEQGRFEEAVPILEAVLANDPHRAKAYFSLVYCRKATRADIGLLAKCAAVVESEMTPPDDRQRLHYALGKAHDDLGEYETAIRHFDAANEILSHRTLNREYNPKREAAYIDLSIGLFTPEFFLQNRDLGSPSHTPILIVGMPRSGTTLVEQILSSHPEIGAAGEKLFWIERATSMVDPIRGPDVIRIRELQESYIRLLEGISPGTARVTDKMPNNFQLLGFIHLAFPNARIIHCRRNPVDNCVSLWTTPFGGKIYFAHDKRNIVTFYTQYLRLMDHYRQVLPSNRLMEIDYEDVVADQEVATRAMIEFCGVEWDDACLHHEQNAATINTPSMWQARQPIYKTSVERWRKYEPWLGEFRDLIDSMKTGSELFHAPSPNDI